MGCHASRIRVAHGSPVRANHNSGDTSQSKLPPSKHGDQAPSRAKKWCCPCWGSAPTPVIPEDSERLGSDLMLTTTTTFHLSAGSFHVSTASLSAPPPKGGSKLPAESQRAPEVRSLASPVVPIGVRFIANNRLQQMHDNAGSTYLQVERQLPRRPAPAGGSGGRLAQLTPTGGDISPLITERSSGHPSASARTSARTSACGSMISNASPAASAEAHRAALLDGFADEAAAFVFGGVGGRSESPDPSFLLGDAHRELGKLSPVA